MKWIVENIAKRTALGGRKTRRIHTDIPVPTTQTSIYPTPYGSPFAGNALWR